MAVPATGTGLTDTVMLLEVAGVQGLLVTLTWKILVVAGLTVNELPVTVVHEVPLFELNSYTVDPVVLVYDAVNVVEFPAHIVAVPANDTVGLGMAVIFMVLLVYGVHPELVTLTCTWILLEIG